MLASCALEEVGDDVATEDVELAESEQALVSVGSFTMLNAYYSTDLLGLCNPLFRREIRGHEPSASGKYPVFVYLTGTTMSYNGDEARQLTEQMAGRGFVAASVEYDNALYPTCGLMTAKASCVFNKNSSNSAISKLCSRAKADCSKGIVVSGFSQGANLAALAKNYDSRVRAAFLVGHGNVAAGLINVSSCANNSATTLLPSQMRSINGESDGFFGGDAAGVRSQLQAVVGVSCPGSMSCLQADGSGWAIVPANQLSDGSADHCYYFNNGSLTCGSNNGFDPTWLTGSQPWSMSSNLNWLASKATP
jgi:hypothetical protein